MNLFLASIAALALALAATPPEETLRKADDALSNADFQGAITALNAMDPSATAAQRSKGALLKAEARMGLGDTAGAEAALAEALAADPDAAVDPAKSGKTLAAMMTKLREQTFAELSVVTDPAGAAVSVDGKPAGQAPLHARLNVGTHEVEVQFSAPDEKQQRRVALPVDGTSAAFARTAVPAEKVTATPSTKSPRVLPWALVAAGAVGAGVGGYLVADAVQFNDRKLTMDINQAAAAQSSAQTQRSIGLAVGLVGVACAATGVGLLLQGDDEQVSAGVALGGQSVGMSVAGRF